MPQYEQLWAELNERRSHAGEISPPAVPHPLCDDPFRIYAHYPTNILSPEQKLSLGKMGSKEALELLKETWLTNFGGDRRTHWDTIGQIIDALATAQSLSVQELLHRFGGTEVGSQLLLYRTLVYLLKFNILAL